MKLSHDEGIASHIGPESCAFVRKNKDGGSGNRNKVFFLSFLDQIFLQFLDSFHEMLVKSPLTPLFQRGGEKRPFPK